MRSTKITLSLTALALGTVLTALPAAAQNYPLGRNVNDGGWATIKTDNAGTKSGSLSNEQSAGPNGNFYAFGAQGQPPEASGRGLYNNYSEQSAPQGYKYPTGRNVNDGGIATAQFDKGAERTGSNSNREAFRSGSESYSYGAQGQKPMTAPSTYGHTN